MEKASYLETTNDTTHPIAEVGKVPFVREKVLAREVDLVYVSTEEQVDDVLTKDLGI